jgi:hypothetical protein
MDRTVKRINPPADGSKVNDCLMWCQLIEEYFSEFLVRLDNLVDAFTD